MNNRYKMGLVLVLAIPALLYFGLGRQAPATQAQVPQMHLDLQGIRSNLVPPDCSVWHELYPVYCTPHHQSGYEDNGDGLISPCDYLWLDGARWHIVWVGPTYFTTCGHGNQHYLEPTVEQTGEDPTCETWRQVYPLVDGNMEEYHIDDWYDGNNNGLLDVCDIAVILSINEYLHIDSIGVDVIVEPAPTSTDETSWGRVKRLFGDLF